MKAYIISEDGEGSAVVRFAKHAVIARREGANELNDEFRYVSCRRAPEFDQYASGPVPTQALLDNGWWMYCGGCGNRIEACTEPEPVVIKNEAYCSRWCRLRLFERRGRDLAQRHLAERLAKQKFPGAINLYGFRTNDQRGSKREVLRARFQFPGGLYPATFHIETDTCWINPVDTEAFDVWKASGYNGDKQCKS